MKSKFQFYRRQYITGRGMLLDFIYSHFEKL